MDELRYTYTGTGNQLSRVDDVRANLPTEEGFKEAAQEANEYRYDKNGNMYVDKNKAIEVIRYNMLNLPRVVKKNATDSLMYSYDATGRKLRQQVVGSTAKITDYAGEFFYENDTLKFINHEEGRTVMTTQVPAYEYFLKDHLGNVRVSFKAITEMTEYKTTMEDNTASGETAAFKNYSAGARSALNAFDHTDAASVYTYSQLLNGGNNSQIGLAKSFEVMAGDVFDIEVFAKFETNTGSTTSLNNLVDVLATAFNLPSAGGVGLESYAARQGFNGLYGSTTYIGVDEPYEDNTAP
jgi:hypothetical protein